MTSVSYSDVFSIKLDREHDEEIFPGDTVRMGQNLYPHFEVIAVNGDKAWVRNLQTGEDHLALTARCRNIEPRIVAAAA
jgi:hypothetical protein